MAHLDLDASLKETLQHAEASHCLRSLQALDFQENSLLVHTEQGKTLHHFSSNDYLQLSQHPALKEASQTAIARYGTGINSSRLIAGEHPLHHALEVAVADWKQSETALIFSSGFQANISVIQALCSKGYILSDKLNHASLVDGCRLATLGGAKWQRYRHLDYQDLEDRLKKIRAVDAHAPIWLISDTLFSMDGDTLDVRRWSELANRYGAFTYVDEAHAAGIYGNKRRSGLVEASETPFPIHIHMGTFSKALGGFGAYVACSQAVRDTLINQARGFIYTTSLPPAVLAANREAVRLVQSEESPVSQLWDNIRLFQEGLRQHPQLSALQVPVSHSQIIPLMLKDNHRTLQAEAALKARGFLVKAVRPPTVPEGQARLRLSLSAGHQASVLKALLEVLAFSGDFSDSSPR